MGFQPGKAGRPLGPSGLYIPTGHTQAQCQGDGQGPARSWRETGSNWSPSRPGEDRGLRLSNSSPSRPSAAPANHIGYLCGSAGRRVSSSLYPAWAVRAGGSGTSSGTRGWRGWWAGAHSATGSRATGRWWRTLPSSGRRPGRSTASTMDGRTRRPYGTGTGGLALSSCIPSCG